MSAESSIISTVSEYYAATVAAHGATAKGVDWNSEESQHARFFELCRVFDREQAPFSLLDFGCGWGGLLEYITHTAPTMKVSYTGYDIVPEMIEAAKKKNGSAGQWLTEIDGDARFDYVIASGIFNVRQKHTDQEWLDYIKTSLNQFDRMTNKGFSFNMLTSYSDPPKMRDYLYYADPLVIFDYCKRTFSRSVALLHDYPLYEFTILVRK